MKITSIFFVLVALAGPPQLDIKMVSIPGSSQGVDINYNKSSPGAGSSPFSPIGSPSSPSPSWEESMMQLSRDLQVICRSPDRYDMPIFPPTPGGLPTSGPTSPTGGSIANNPLRADRSEVGKLLNVRHVQSEEKLREKLTYICRSPRRSRAAVASEPSTEGSRKPKQEAAPRPTKRRPSHVFPYFKANIEIGDHTIEDLSVIIEDHKLKVFSERKEEGDIFSRGDLPAIIDLPTDVNPQKLICIVRDGILEVKESKRKCPTANKLLGRQLSMSYSTSGFRGDRLRPCRTHDSDQCPIVIEDDGSHLLKLVLRVPPGYKFDDIQIKTIDNQLMVTGKRGPQRSLSASFSPTNWNKQNKEDEDSFTKVFELPSSVDPFSITARLTDQNQLIIQAKLSPRSRSNTL